jgi:hypothetical protein
VRWRDQRRGIAAEMRAHGASRFVPVRGGERAIGALDEIEPVVRAHEAGDERRRRPMEHFLGRPHWMMRPASMTAMRSASVSASSRSCVT